MTVNLMHEGQYLGYAKDPDRITREIAALREPGVVVIDEIQRVPSLLNTLQTIIDDPACRHRFVITGSSARKLKRGSANLLPGRIIKETLTPFNVLELGNDFNLERALQVGMLPGIYLDSLSGVDVLGTYADVYLREEVQAEALTKSIGAYARFLDLIAATSGQWLNYSKLAADSEIPKETIRRYVALLEDTLLAHRLAAFRPQAGVARRVIQHDRILLFDIGVRNALLGTHGIPTPGDQIGPLFEHWFILQVISLQGALKRPWKLSSYRSHAGAEVDLVVETPGCTIGIEIKAATNVGTRTLAGLRSLAELMPAGRPFLGWVVYRGSRAQRLADGFEAKPYRNALIELVNID